jgi:hypothetical protein
VPPWSAVCHWRLRLRPDYSFGDFAAIYDFAGPGTVPDDQQDIFETTLRGGERFQFWARIATTNYNTNTARIRMCLYLRENQIGTGFPRACTEFQLGFPLRVHVVRNAVV